MTKRVAPEVDEAAEAKAVEPETVGCRAEANEAGTGDAEEAGKEAAPAGKDPSPEVTHPLSPASADGNQTVTTEISRHASRTQKVTPFQVAVIFVVCAVPTAVIVVFFSLMGFGMDVLTFVARANTNMLGNGLVCLVVVWLCLLFVLDVGKAHPLLAMPQYALLALTMIAATVFKGISYPWGAPVLIMILMPSTLLRLRTSPRWEFISRLHFYRAVGGSTFATGLLLLIVWLSWTYATDYTEDGAGWTTLTKARLIIDFKDVYDHAYSKRPLVYAEDCGPLKNVTSYSEKEQATIDTACRKAETVWFVVWMVPFGAVVFNLLVTAFCLLESRFKLTDGKDVVKLLQQFVSLLVFLIMGMYVSIYASGVSVYLASAFMAVFVAAVLALMIYANHEVEPEVLARVAAENRFAKNMSQAFKSDWTRAAGVVSTNVLIPLMLMLDMLRQQVRKRKGTAADPTKHFTKNGQKFWNDLLGWQWNQIFTKVCLLCELFAMLILGGKCTYVLFSWLNYDVLDGMSLIVIIIFVFIVGCLMFLLPMVPGSAVYLFAGIVIGKQSQSAGSIGFWPGVVVASILGLAAKLCACCGQYGIGFKLGQSVKIQKMIGVDTLFTRAIEKILNQRGLKLGKVAILVGGPDWPTSVTCGILKLNIPQMLLGTLPVYIASIAPQTLVGALLTKESDGNTTLWSSVTTACTGVAAVCQAAACLVATRTIIQTVERDADELSQFREEHAKVAELTRKEADYVQAFKEVEKWDQLSVRRRATISAAAYLQLLSAFLLAADFVLMEPVCFKKFAVNDRIGGPDGVLGGNVLNVVLLPLGAASLSICAVGCAVHYWHGKDMARLARERLREDSIPDAQISG